MLLLQRSTTIFYRKYLSNCSYRVSAISKVKRCRRNFTTQNNNENAKASSSASVLGKVPKAPHTTLYPKELVGASKNKSDYEYFSEFLKSWLKNNAAILVLNFGSVCTLLAFTRSDILELRILSMTGSAASIFYFYQHTPIAILPICWSSIFFATNLYMVYRIYSEREGRVVMSPEEIDLYEEHFLPHGVTPRQFERLMSKAHILHYPKNSTIINKGDELSSVYLVAKGGTLARTGGKYFLSRYITAASSHEGNRERLPGGDAGAWIGEISFLEELASLEKRRYKKDFDEKCKHDALPENSNAITHRKALMTYKTVKDTTIYAWTFCDLSKLLDSSNEMRASLTRAMTAAIVGKVTNLTLSKAAPPSWAKWLSQRKVEKHGDLNVILDDNISDGDLEV